MYCVIEMINKQGLQKVVHGIQTGVETFGALKGLYHAGQVAFGVGRTIGAAAVPFLL